MLERYRICELFAELLHCSNMSNRPPEYDELYDEQGRLRGGLAALEGLAQVISLNQTGDRERGPIETIEDEVEPALELPVHGASRSPVFSSDEDMSSDEEPANEDAMAMFDEPQSMSPAQEPSPLPPSSMSPPECSPPENPFSPPPPERTPPGTPLARTASRSQHLSPSQ